MSDTDEDDLLAAEFVLGTLDLEEQSRVEIRLTTDDRLRQVVADWETRFSPLLDLYPQAVPPPHVLTMLMTHVSDPVSPASDAASSTVILLRRSVRRWRYATAAAMAMAAALIGWIVVAPDAGRGGRFVAVLQKDANSPAILLSVDVGARRAILRQVSSEQPPEKSYELWLINPEVGAPHSLGVLQPKGATNASLASFDSTVIARATYAITVEPPGGSPNGQPSGPPILSGKLVDEAH